MWINDWGSPGAAARTSNTHCSDATQAASQLLCILLNFIYSYWIMILKSSLCIVVRKAPSCDNYNAQMTCWSKDEAQFVSTVSPSLIGTFQLSHIEITVHQLASGQILSVKHIVHTYCTHIHKTCMYVFRIYIYSVD